MDIVEMVLAGRVNKGLVSLIQAAGGRAVGLCGKDSALLQVRSAACRCMFATSLLVHQQVLVAMQRDCSHADMLSGAALISVHMFLPRSCGLQARQLVEQDIGYVGEITRVDVALLASLVAEGFIPVVSTVAADRASGHALNVNADTAAGEIAAALQARAMLSCSGCASVGQRL